MSILNKIDRWLTCDNCTRPLLEHTNLADELKSAEVYGSDDGDWIGKMIWKYSDIQFTVKDFSSKYLFMLETIETKEIDEHLQEWGKKYGSFNASNCKGFMPNWSWSNSPNIDGYVYDDDEPMIETMKYYQDLWNSQNIAFAGQNSIELFC